jgi:hypothetical protein
VRLWTLRRRVAPKGKPRHWASVVAGFRPRLNLEKVSGPIGGNAFRPACHPQENLLTQRLAGFWEVK